MALESKVTPLPEASPRATPRNCELSEPGAKTRPALPLQLSATLGAPLVSWPGAVVASITTLRVIRGRSLCNVIVPLTAKSIVDCVPIGAAFAAPMAARREPTPESFKFVTVNAAKTGLPIYLITGAPIYSQSLADDILTPTNICL